MIYTKYEKARLVGARALQLELGAPILINVDDSSMNSLAIALAEFENDLLPITVKRK